MKLKHILISAFVFVAAVPQFIGLHFLNHRMADQHALDVEANLMALSQIAKERLLASIERIEDNTALIASRTQMRISLKEWTRTGKDLHRMTILRILEDAQDGLTNLKSVNLFDPAGQLTISTFPSVEVRHLEPKTDSTIKITLQFQDGETIVASETALHLGRDHVGYLQLTFFADFINDLSQDRTGLGETGEWILGLRNENGDAVFAFPLKYDPDAAFSHTIAKTRQDVPITKALMGEEVVLRHATDYAGNLVFASTRYIPELDWGLVAKINESEVNQYTFQNLYLILISGIALLGLATAIGIGLSIYIARPVERLKTQTSKIAEGDFSNPLVPRGWQEVKELTLHFSAMAGALKNMNKTLNDTVQQRTKELAEANQKLREISIRDPLTNLYNRRYFDIRFSEEFQRAIRYKHTLSIVIADLDFFKQINDTYGHPAGDVVLKEVGRLLVDRMRNSDIVARIGGEEFCLIIPENHPADIDKILDRIRGEIAEMDFETEDGSFTITCSFGVAHLSGDSKNETQFLQNADKALYNAKKNGRNQVFVHTPASV
ncbi:diguanylate cyclase [Labrenzia sp. PHM005]|uniref:sensor domain-containing diguanylate cyclase n=1 Tax=Labrenzia sp. PHM005 TaxID=2590016 RepID=UPI00114025EC|nr:diguanylate cyclase [Labrenzia sp. PHM005]QDG76913.1 diguanylate cyclase [Labrenzia sp. PHM005]